MTSAIVTKWKGLNKWVKLAIIVVALIILLFILYELYEYFFAAKPGTVVMASPTTTAPPVAVTPTPAPTPTPTPAPTSTPIVSTPTTVPTPTSTQVINGYTYDTGNAPGWQGVYGQTFNVPGWGSGGSYSATSFADCQNKCTATTGCKAVTYNTNMSPDCQMAIPYGTVLFNSTTAMTPMLGWQLGVLN